MARDDCLRRESRRLADGRVCFKAQKTRFWTFAENGVELRARVCVDGGAVDLYADTAKLKRLVKP